MPMKSPIDLERVERLTVDAKAVLANHHPMEQGAVLIQFVSLWLAGHRPDFREELWQLFRANVWAMLQVDAAEFDTLHREIAESLDRRFSKS